MTKVAVLLALFAATAAADPASDAAALRKTCTSAMEADPNLARDIIVVALNRESRDVSSLCADADTLKTHQQAAARVETNERQVVLAYGAMWVIAAVFVAFLWWRQRALRAEIAQLRKDLDAAAKEAK